MATLTTSLPTLAEGRKEPIASDPLVAELYPRAPGHWDRQLPVAGPGTWTSSSLASRHSGRVGHQRRVSAPASAGGGPAWW